jgi:hypothetical protein
MTQHATIYDYMAERFRALGKAEYPVDALIEDAANEGYTELWDMSKHGMANAMRVRGLEIASGMVRLPKDGDGQHYDPIATDYREFTAAAAELIKDLDHPIDAADLIERLALPSIAVPMSTMAFYLRRVGVHYIPGVGYWRAPQYVDPSGRIVSKRIHSERVKALSDLFEAQGWPVVGREAETATGGLVTSRFLTRYALGHGRQAIKGIGGGLYVPADRFDAGPIPMSRNVAAAMLSLPEGAMIDDHDHLRLYRIAILMEAKKLATLTRSRTTRERIRRQTLRVSINDAGRAMLERIARRTRDEF